MACAGAGWPDRIKTSTPSGALEIFPPLLVKKCDHPVLVLGLGNDILTDDAVGLKVVQELRRRLADEPRVEAIDCCEMGLGLLDHIVNHLDLVVVDSVQTGKAPPGHVHEVEEEDLPSLPGMSPHFLGVGEVLVLGRKIGETMPTRVKIYAIEAADPMTLGEALSPELERALPGIVERIETLVRAWAQDHG